MKTYSLVLAAFLAVLSVGCAARRVSIMPISPYPPLARQARIEGRVVIKVMLDDKGNIRVSGVLSGHPILIPTAERYVEAIRFTAPRRKGDGEINVTVVFKLDHRVAETNAEIDMKHHIVIITSNAPMIVPGKSAAS